MRSCCLCSGFVLVFFVFIIHNHIVFISAPSLFVHVLCVLTLCVLALFVLTLFVQVLFVLMLCVLALCALVLFVLVFFVVIVMCRAKLLFSSLLRMSGPRP